MNMPEPDARFSYLSNSPQQTEWLATAMAQLAQPGMTFALIGELGAGKTCFARRFSETLGIESSAVSSPTYVIIQHYLGDHLIHHMDLYRLESADEFYDLGGDELIHSRGISLVEWANKYPELMPPECVTLEFSSKGEQSRQIECSATGKLEVELLQEVEKMSQDSEYS